MVTAEKPRTTTSRESWADWLPDVEPTLTIDDVMERLKARGIDDITVENIRLWQHRRVLPAPIRRQVGTGKGSTRALYPPQAVDAIAEVRPLQRHGVPLRKIRDRLAGLFGLNTSPVTVLGSAHAAGTSHVTAYLTVSDSAQLKTTDSASVDDPAFLEAMTKAARSQEQRVGAPIREVEVTFTDTRGRKHSRVYTLDTEIEH